MTFFHPKSSLSEVECGFLLFFNEFGMVVYFLLILCFSSATLLAWMGNCLSIIWPCLALAARLLVLLAHADALDDHHA